MTKNNKGRKRYTQEFKKSVLKRLEPPTNDTIASLSDELGVSKTSIYKWINEQNNKTGHIKSTVKWTAEDKFHMVLETSNLSEQELAAYCRRKGLFVEDINALRNQCIRANVSHSKDPLKLEKELKKEKRKTKNLEKELRRKEKALAETAALLVLRKKAQAIWGDPKED